MEANGFNVVLITIEVGLQDFTCLNGFQQLCDITLISSKQIRCLLRDVSRAAITGSYKIWT